MKRKMRIFRQECLIKKAHFLILQALVLWPFWSWPSRQVFSGVGRVGRTRATWWPSTSPTCGSSFSPSYLASSAQRFRQEKPQIIPHRAHNLSHHPFQVTALKGSTVGLGILVLVMGLSVRIVTSFLSVSCSDLNLKERLFVALAWLPKATVQAAIGPLAYDHAKNSPDPNEQYIEWGLQVGRAAQ